MLDSNSDSHDDVEVKNSGSGIHSEIFHDLFSKFVSNSDIGSVLNCIFPKILLKLLEVIVRLKITTIMIKKEQYSLGLPLNK